MKYICVTFPCIWATQSNFHPLNERRKSLKLCAFFRRRKLKLSERAGVIINVMRTGNVRSMTEVGEITVNITRRDARQSRSALQNGNKLFARGWHHYNLQDLFPQKWSTYSCCFFIISRWRRFYTNYYFLRSS